MKPNPIKLAFDICKKNFPVFGIMIISISIILTITEIISPNLNDIQKYALYNLKLLKDSDTIQNINLSIIIKKLIIFNILYVINKYIIYIIVSLFIYNTYKYEENFRINKLFFEIKNNLFKYCKIAIKLTILLIIEYIVFILIVFIFASITQSLSQFIVSFLLIGFIVILFILELIIMSMFVIIIIENTSIKESFRISKKVYINTKKDISNILLLQIFLIILIGVISKFSYPFLYNILGGVQILFIELCIMINYKIFKNKNQIKTEKEVIEL